MKNNFKSNPDKFILALVQMNGDDGEHLAKAEITPENYQKLFANPSGLPSPKEAIGKALDQLIEDAEIQSSGKTRISFPVDSQERHQLDEFAEALGVLPGEIAKAAALSATPMYLRPGACDLFGVAKMIADTLPEYTKKMTEMMNALRLEDSAIGHRLALARPSEVSTSANAAEYVLPDGLDELRLTVRIYEERLKAFDNLAKCLGLSRDQLASAMIDAGIEGNEDNPFDEVGYGMMDSCVNLYPEHVEFKSLFRAFEAVDEAAHTLIKIRQEMGCA